MTAQSIRKQEKKFCEDNNISDTESFGSEDNREACRQTLIQHFLKLNQDNFIFEKNNSNIICGHRRKVTETDVESWYDRERYIMIKQQRFVIARYFAIQDHWFEKQLDYSEESQDNSENNNEDKLSYDELMKQLECLKNENARLSKENSTLRAQRNDKKRKYSEYSETNKAAAAANTRPDSSSIFQIRVPPSHRR